MYVSGNSEKTRSVTENVLIPPCEQILSLLVKHGLVNVVDNSLVEHLIVELVRMTGGGE